MLWCSELELVTVGLAVAADSGGEGGRVTKYLCWYDGGNSRWCFRKIFAQYFRHAWAKPEWVMANNRAARTIWKITPLYSNPTSYLVSHHDICVLPGPVWAWIHPSKMWDAVESHHNIDGRRRPTPHHRFRQDKLDKAGKKIYFCHMLKQLASKLKSEKKRPTFLFET